jgi:hypothetical protein
VEDIARHFDLPAESGGKIKWQRVGGLLISIKMQAQFVIYFAYSWV